MAEFDYSKPFTVPGQEVNLVPNLLPPASYKPDITDRIADAAERGYKFYRQSELINKPLTRETADEVDRLQREIEEIPDNPALVKFQRAQGWREAAGAIIDDPIETIGGLMAESLGSMIPKAIKTVPAHMLVGAGAGFAIGGPPGALLGARAGAATGTGVTSYSLEYAGKVLESLREEGVDIKNPEQLYTAFTTPDLMDGVKSKAVRKGVPIAAFDALSALVGGAFLSRGGGALRKVGQAGAEAITQSGLGMGGEVAGELAAGEKLNPASILAEGIVELPGSIPEVATGVLTRKTRPLGERTRSAPQERQEVVPVERAGTETQRTPTEASPGNRVLQAAQVEPAPQETVLEIPQAVATQTGWTFNPANETGGMTLTGLTPDQVAQMPKLWEFTDRRPDSPTRDYTTYVPQSYGPEQGVVHIQNKTQEALQGDRRSSQLERPLTEGPAPIPVAPPAIEVIGEVQVEQQPLMDRVLETIKQENALAIGLPIRKVEIIDNPEYAVSTIPAGGGFDTIYVNLGKLQKDVSATGERAEEFLSSVLNEEIIHNAGGRVVYDEWNTGTEDVKSATPFSEFYHQKMLNIYREMTPDQIARVQQTYGKPLTEEGLADEFTRMLVQERMRGKITEETLGREALEHLKKILRQLLDALKTAVGIKRQNLQAHVNSIQSILTEQQARSTADRFDVAGQPLSAAAEPAPSPEESPFDRIRREADLGPAPEPLTPEQEKAREVNERNRTMRPNPRFAGAASPVEEAAYENGDDVWVTTKVAGTEDNIRDRTRVTVESTVTAQEHAKAIFNEAGVQVEWLEAKPANPDTGQPGKGIWKYVKTPNEEGGRKLAQLLERELKKENTDENVLLMGSLINSIRYNDKLGNADGVFDLPTRRALYAMSQAAASIRGVMLQELNQHPASIDDVARNVDLVLNRVWHDAFGGEVIDDVMAEIRKGTQAFITRPLIQHVLAQNPALQGALDAAAFNEDLKGLPDALALLEEVFATPFYNLADFGKALEKRLIEQYKVDPKEAAKIAKEFQAAFDPSLKQGANEALKIAVSNLSYEAKTKVKGKKSIEALVMEAIKQGALESGEVLRKIAKDNHWNPPTDEQIDHMKKLSDRLVQLKNLKPADLAERRKMGATDQDIENARRDKVAKLGSEIARVRKDMETAWARMTKPVSLIYGLPLIGQPEIRANTARAINEFIAANLLAKFGFGTRQFVAIFSQFVAYVPTRSVADAMVNRAHSEKLLLDRLKLLQKLNGSKAEIDHVNSLIREQRNGFIKDVASQLRDGYKQQFGAIRPALAAAQAAFLGRGGGQQIGQLMSGLNALDRLTKQAEERWAAGDYARASLLYFFSSVKLGYRIAQGLDRLQGIPAHYQNMRAQVVRALMDAGKTRLEADNSADLVIGDMNAQWMLATVAVRDAMLAEGIEVTPQKVRQNSWNLVKRWQYQRIQEAGLKADEFEAESEFLENTIGWNKKEVKGLGGAIARGLRQAEQVAEGYGVPLVMTRFSNAIGIIINRGLAYTLLWNQANKGGPGESAWFRSEVDRAQRRVEGYAGTAMGAIAMMLAYSGILVVRTKWPKDKEERDLLERQGSRLNTVEYRISDSEFIPFSLNNSPFMFVAPYLAAGAALREKVDELAKKQASLDAHASELGVTAERLPGLSVGDYGLVAVAAAQQAILGGRTVSGLIGSVSTYGVPNAKKTAASYVSALTPWLPGAQEVTRMAGVTLDERLATVGDFILPLPTSGARKLNLLGDPVRTPDDLQRITQVLTGGSYPGIVDGNRAKEVASYKALFESGYRPPSINPMQGYLIDGTIRPMKGTELQRYTEARGRNLKEALDGFVATGDQDQDKKAARDLYKSANDAALSEVGAATVPRYSSGASTVKAPSAPRASRPRSGIRSARRLRSPRLRGGRIRRIRARSSRRVRRIRSVRLAA